MKRNIFAFVALIAVLGILLLYSPAGKGVRDPGDSLFSGLNFPSSVELPNLGDSFNRVAAWGVFQDYLKFAQAHDLEGVKSLSYQLSPACKDKARRAECDGLMDSIYLIAGEFESQDFQNIIYDDKQIVMMSKYLPTPGQELDVRTVLYFVKSDKGEPKVLGIRFCYGSEAYASQCVETRPDSRDKNQNGWWDDVEALFK